MPCAVAHTAGEVGKGGGMSPGTVRAREREKCWRHYLRVPRGRRSGGGCWLPGIPIGAVVRRNVVICVHIFPRGGLRRTKNVLFVARNTSKTARKSRCDP